MLARGLLCRLAARPAPKTTTHDISHLARLLHHTHLSSNVTAAPAVRALSNVYTQARRGYATDSATKPTKTVKKAVKETATKKPAAKKKTATTKAASKKKKAAAKKPAKKAAKKPKRELTPEEKEKELVKRLKKQALREPATGRPVSSWVMFTAEAAKSTPNFVRAGQEVRHSLMEKWNNLTAAEREHYNHLANERRAENQQKYDEWLRNYTPEDIRRANSARAYLRRLHKAKGKGVPKHTSKLVDDRVPAKKPSNVYAVFTKERWASGDMKGISIRDAGKLIANEYKALSPSERKKYEDMSKQEHEEYQRACEAVATA